MLRDILLTFMLVFVKSLVILEFYNNFSSINVLSKTTHA
jgi:hypothetical protein